MDKLKNNKPLLLGMGIVLMVGGMALSVIKETKQEPKPASPPPVSFSKPEELPPPPNMFKPEELPKLELPEQPVKKMEGSVKPEPIKPVEGKKEETEQTGAEIVRIDEKKAMIRLNGKAYVCERKKEHKSKSHVVAKKKREQSERTKSELAIVCSGKSRECLLYEGGRSYMAEDTFKGAKIERIDIDGVYLSNREVLRVE